MGCKMRVAKMPYLERHKGLWRVRIIISPLLRPYLDNKTALVRSTGTGNRAEANKIAVPVIAEFKAMLARAEAERRGDEVHHYTALPVPYSGFGGSRLVLRTGPEPNVNDPFWHNHTRLDGTRPEGAAGSLSTYTLAWAYGRWLIRAQKGNRRPWTIKTAERHWKAFIAHAKLTMLDQAKRRHLLAWRDGLVGAGEHANKSINQRIQLVSAILRVGWRDAEMDQPDLKDITLPEPDDSDRQSWNRNEILRALRNLEPNSWSTWTFLIGLTVAGGRLGELVAAHVGWYDPGGFILVRDRRQTKSHKFHCYPIIECLRQPLANYVATRPADGFLFDAPRPAKPDVPIGNVASKALNRMFKKAGIERCYHELRDTWIEAARHSSIEKAHWEIISTHSASTTSDLYGGKKRETLADWNETICEFLTNDAEIKTEILRLVGVN